MAKVLMVSSLDLSRNVMPLGSLLSIHLWSTLWSKILYSINNHEYICFILLTEFHYISWAEELDMKSRRSYYCIELDWRFTGRIEEREGREARKEFREWEVRSQGREPALSFLSKTFWNKIFIPFLALDRNHRHRLSVSVSIGIISYSSFPQIPSIHHYLFHLQLLLTPYPILFY